VVVSSTVRDLRQGNRARVLRALLLKAETTRAQLTEASQLSPSTVTNVVRDLMEEGLVEEVGTVPSNGGRPITKLSPRPDGAHLLGVEVSEHGVRVEAFDLALRRVDLESREFDAREVRPAAVASALHSSIGTVLGRQPEMAATLVGVGLGVPGVVEVNGDGLEVIYAQNLGWEPIEVDTLLALDIPVFADNGAKALASAETWLGAAQDVAHSVVVLIGHGIGAGIITDGHLVRGVSGSAGEWGHTKIALGGPLCSCGARGCLEARVGGGAIVARWSEATGVPVDDEAEALRQLLDGAVQGDRHAQLIVEDVIETLGAGLANLVNLFNPEQLVVGGWAGLEIVRSHRPDLLASIRRGSLERPGNRFALETAQLGENAVALGAALLPLERLIEGTIPSRGGVRP
jgi:predicted NBD/HSP70 family sugar kinase